MKEEVKHKEVWKERRKTNEATAWRAPQLRRSMPLRWAHSHRWAGLQRGRTAAGMCKAARCCNERWQPKLRLPAGR